MTSGVLLDIAGVLYEGDRAVPGASDAVGHLREAGLPIRFLTNSTRSSKRQIVEKLQALGFDVDPSEVMTPAAAARDWLTREGFTPHLLIHPDLEEDFRGLAPASRTAVLVGDAGRLFDYHRLNVAFRLIDDGAPLVALAANRTFRDADGRRSLDAGAFVRALEHASGQKALVLGKPSPDYFDAASRSMGCDLGEVAMIGDDAESDIAGALSAGAAEAILVRTGKYCAEDETRFTPHPTAVTADVSEAVAHVLGGFA